MPKPFIILALPRSGTKMLVSALDSHPDLSDVGHEFKGTEEEFLKHPYVLANEYKDWMAGVNMIHMYRADSFAGAKSLLLLGYTFPPCVINIPINEVAIMAAKRRKWDEKLASVAAHSISYEECCGGVEARMLPVSNKLCEWLGLPFHPLTTEIKKNHKIIPKNEVELQCLSA